MPDPQPKRPRGRPTKPPSEKVATRLHPWVTEAEAEVYEALGAAAWLRRQLQAELAKRSG